MVWSVLFSPDGKRLVSISEDGTAQLLEIESLQAQPIRLEHDHPVRAVAFSSDGSRLATGGGRVNPSQGATWIWDSASGKRLGRLRHIAAVNALIFSPDGKFLATAGRDMQVRLWDIDSGEEHAQLVHEDIVYAVTFDPSGRYLATASADSTARVWDVQTGQELVRVSHEATASVNAVAFSPDGRYLATAGNDGATRVSPWRTQDLIDAACARLSRNLTREEWRQYLGAEPFRQICPQ